MSREDVPGDAGKAGNDKDGKAAGAAPLFASTAADADGKATPGGADSAASGAEKSSRPRGRWAGRGAPRRTNLGIAKAAGQPRISSPGCAGSAGKAARGDVRTRGQLQLQQLATAAGGGNVILQGINQRLSTTADPDSDLRTEFDVLRGRAGAMAEVKSLLDQTPPGIERDALELALLERLTGIIGTVEWLDAQLTVVRQNETGSSFDSELSLVMWPDNYQLLRWQPNYLRPGFDNSQLPKVVPHADGLADRCADAGPGQRSDRHGDQGRKGRAPRQGLHRQPRHRRNSTTPKSCRAATPISTARC